MTSCLRPITASQLVEEQRNAPILPFTRWHHFQRALTRLEQAHEQGQYIRSQNREAESQRDAELLPDTRARILARWAEAVKPGPRVIRPIPIKRAAGA